MAKVFIFWFRRDLRLKDNAGLYHAQRTAQKFGSKVLPIFIFDPEILSKLERKDDPRVSFIHLEIKRLRKELQTLNSNLGVYYGSPLKIWKLLLEEYDVQGIFTNRDYEPYARQRDQAVQELAEEKGIRFRAYKDQVIFEKSEVVKADKSPYVVFTPYCKIWRAKLASRVETKNGKSQSFYLKSYPNARYNDQFYKFNAAKIPSLSSMGFESSSTSIPDRTVSSGLIRKYEAQRNFPAMNGTSKLGLHFRFGTISVREKARKAMSLSGTYVNELIWRDFYSQILYHFPQVVNEAFRTKYNYIEWRNNEEEFQAWCEGKTGYPIVDAGMRELNATGFMHNRVRMITASFLTKHLLIDWQWGEAYFAKMLLDFDLASNNGGWQWAAGCGTDAAPYFRIFNPYAQKDKFDKEGKYIKKWIPEILTQEYPKAIVDHKLARERCLAVYKAGLAKAESRL